MNFMEALNEYYNANNTYKKYVGKTYLYGKQKIKILAIVDNDFKCSDNRYRRASSFIDDVKHNVYEEVKED